MLEYISPWQDLGQVQRVGPSPKVVFSARGVSKPDGHSKVKLDKPDVQHNTKADTILDPEENMTLLADDQKTSENKTGKLNKTKLSVYSASSLVSILLASIGSDSIGAFHLTSENLITFLLILSICFLGTFTKGPSKDDSPFRLLRRSPDEGLR